MINGVINVYKERGYTSHDVVAKLRGITHQKKIGHTGTLDPEAEGVLLVCFGAATRVCDQIEDWKKRYHAVCRLGVLTDTQDLTGEVLETREVACTEEEIRGAADSFLGTYEQTPPMYSAVRVGGKHLYELARQGKTVERKSRTVTIDEIKAGAYDEAEHTVTLDIVCSKGTYIRTLCEDLGNKLGCGAAMQSLVRTGVGAFRSEDALRLSEIEELFQAGELSQVLIPIESLYPDLPSLHVSAQAEKLLKNGNPLSLSDVSCDNTPADGQLFLVYDVDCAFQAVYRYEEANGRFSPHKMFLS